MIVKSLSTTNRSFAGKRMANKKSAAASQWQTIMVPFQGLCLQVNLARKFHK
jgi:hypothetical protein